MVTFSPFNKDSDLVISMSKGGSDNNGGNSMEDLIGLNSYENYRSTGDLRPSFNKVFVHNLVDLDFIGLESLLQTSVSSSE